MTQFNVKGMHCRSCEMLIQDSLEEEGATEVKVDHQKGIVNFDGLDPNKAKELIHSEGFEVE